jgi:hypothetical protein
MEIKHDIEIAKLYSEGKIIVDEIASYRERFQELKDKVVELAKQNRGAGT